MIRIYGNDAAFSRIFGRESGLSGDSPVRSSGALPPDPIGAGENVPAGASGAARGSAATRTCFDWPLAIWTALDDLARCGAGSPAQGRPERRRPRAIPPLVLESKCAPEAPGLASRHVVAQGPGSRGPAGRETASSTAECDVSAAFWPCRCSCGPPETLGASGVWPLDRSSLLLRNNLRDIVH